MIIVILCFFDLSATTQKKENNYLKKRKYAFLIKNTYFLLSICLELIKKFKQNIWGLRTVGIVISLQTNTQ